VFEGIGRNKSFLIVMAVILAMQFVFVTFGGEFLSVESLSPMSWLICVVLAFLVIPIDMIRKALTKRAK
jgi:magnesium-transporting ATPase (P-type)